MRKIKLRRVADNDHQAIVALLNECADGEVVGFTHGMFREHWWTRPRGAYSVLIASDDNT